MALRYRFAIIGGRKSVQLVCCGVESFGLMVSMSKVAFLTAMTTFGFLLGSRVPVVPQSTELEWSARSPTLPQAIAPSVELTHAFPKIPLRWQPPVAGVIDLTSATIRQWLSDRSPEVFLTFDDGPSPKATGMILDILQAHDVKATFFVLGHNAAQFPELIERIVAEGHELALHSHTHPDFTTLTRAQQAAEIAQGLSTLHWLVPGIRIRWFRPPYGAYTPDTVEVAHEYGLCLALFNEISTDHTTPAAQIAQTVLKGQGKIIVFHDGQMIRSHDLTVPEQQLIEGLSGSIGPLKANGGQFKTLSSHFGHFCP